MIITNFNSSIKQVDCDNMIDWILGIPNLFPTLHLNLFSLLWLYVLASNAAPHGHNNRIICMTNTCLHTMWYQWLRSQTLSTTGCRRSISTHTFTNFLHLMTCKSVWVYLWAPYHRGQRHQNTYHNRPRMFWLGNKKPKPCVIHCGNEKNPRSKSLPP